jgi:hypothetical protein
MLYRNLIDVLTRVGKKPEACSFPDGSRVLVLPYGGRILGLFSAAGDRNFFWTQPALADAAQAREFYASPEWHNSGGDRTWLGPELDFFFPKYPDLETYFQPRQLDPGNYCVARADGEIRLSNRFEILLARSGSTVEVEIVKTLGPAPDPLRHDPWFTSAGGIEYAGYTLRTSLEIRGGRPHLPPRIGSWNLLQLPHGGELLVPTHRREEPTIWFGEVPEGDLEAGEQGVRYRMRARGGQKIGLRAVATAGRAGYAYRVSGNAALVVRNFPVYPSAEYADVPWTAPDDLGYSFQACNIDDENFGRFSELEYHAPSIGSASGRMRWDDVSELWAYRGRPEQIRAVAASLLGMQPE